MLCGGGGGVTEGAPGPRDRAAEGGSEGVKIATAKNTADTIQLYTPKPQSTHESTLNSNSMHGTHGHTGWLDIVCEDGRAEM